MADTDVPSEKPFENPMFNELLGAWSRMENAPDESTVLKYYATAITLPVDDIVSFIVNDPNFIAYKDILTNAIDGMDIRGIGLVVTRFIDRNYPSLLQSINSNDDEFELYRGVVVALVDRIREVR